RIPSPPKSTHFPYTTLFRSATLKGWDVSERLKELTVPTLMIGGKYDTMDPKYMEWMSTQVQNGRSITCNAGHMSQYDDPETYFRSEEHTSELQSRENLVCRL